MCLAAIREMIKMWVFFHYYHCAGVVVAAAVAAAAASVAAPFSASKRKRCQICPRYKDCKTHTKCCGSDKYICKGCSIFYCPSCAC